MSLLQQWRDIAYSPEMSEEEQKTFWGKYFEFEQGVYEELLAEPETIVEGTVAELAEKYGAKSTLTMMGFLDGINDSLNVANEIEVAEEESPMKLDINHEKLFYNMVEANAEWLYTIEKWDDILPMEKRKELYKKQKASTTFVKETNVGRNDPCPCGSGKKYKKCCANK